MSGSPLTLADYGWDNFFHAQLPLDAGDTVVPARIMNVQRSGFTIAAPGIDSHVDIGATGGHADATVGDWILYDTGSGRVAGRLERKSLFQRRSPGTDHSAQLIAANIDTLFVVSSCNQDFNEARLERYLAIGREAGVMTVIVLTKADLADDTDGYRRRAAVLAPEVLVETVDARDAASLSCLDSWLGNGQTIALLGSSGVGKSTITNTLLGNEALATQAARADDDKGRHTTTARSMHRLPDGAWLVDTPGMRELQLTDVQSGIDDVFAEIAALAEDCRFADCVHEGEPGCAVQAAAADGTVDAARIARWRKLLREEAQNRESIAERRARGRSLGKLYKSAIDQKNASRKR